MITAARLHALGFASYPGDAVLPVIPYALGNIVGPVTIDRNNGIFQTATATGNITINVSGGSAGDFVEVLVTASGGIRNVNFHASINLPSSYSYSTTGFSVVSGKTAALRLVKNGAGVWVLETVECALAQIAAMLNGKVGTGLLGVANGVATLGPQGRLLINQALGLPFDWHGTFTGTNFSSYGTGFVALMDQTASQPSYALMSPADIDVYGQRFNWSPQYQSTLCGSFSILATDMVEINVSVGSPAFGAYPNLTYVYINASNAIEVFSMDGNSFPNLSSFTLMSGTAASISKDDFFNLFDAAATGGNGTCDISAWTDNGTGVTAASQDARDSLTGRGWTLIY